jgi:hypothetical protein
MMGRRRFGGSFGLLEVMLRSSSREIKFFLEIPRSFVRFKKNSKNKYRFSHVQLSQLSRKKDVPKLSRPEGPYGCETSRLPHFLDNRLTDGDKVVSLTRRPPFTPKEDSWYSFLLVAESTQVHSAAGRIRSTEKKNTPHHDSNPRSSGLWHSASIN